MAQIEYLQRRVRSDAIGGDVRRDEYAIPGVPGLSRVCVSYADGISEETIALDGVRYLSMDEAMAVWRAKWARMPIYDAIGNALRTLMLSDEATPWDELSPSKRESWLIGAETFVGKVESLGLHITQGDCNGRCTYICTSERNQDTR